ncbi:hypothetical protein TSUD_379650 [Trifolium subterraneum]|uniref:Uncharacterized protein n=1 Tax=Trifolium subterraneum TaxID=3900 RepID=A0A2Z6N1K8_TRISU|nr:hypothetical protein TSUD_379650 [Trifolium subterraneum]
MLSRNEDTKKTHVEDKVVADSNSDINMEMKNIASDSSFLTGCNVVLTPSIKEGFTANPSIDAYSLLQPTLQVFDPMPTKRLKSTSLNQKPTMTASIPLSKGKNQTFQSAQQHSSPSNLQLLSEVKIKPLSSNTIHVSAQSISLNLNKLKCFDPGGMISLMYFPISSVFISVQFPSRVSLPIPPKPPDWVAVQSSSLKLPLCVTTEGIATTQYLVMYSFPILITVLQVFAEMPMCQVVVWTAIVHKCTYNGNEAVEFDLSKELNRMHIVLEF